MITNIMSKNKVYLLLADKQKIVGEAYAQLNHADQDNCTSVPHAANTNLALASHNPSTGLEENEAVVSTSRKNKTLHKGKNTVITQQ